MVPAVNEVMLVIGSSLVELIVIKVTVTVALGFVALWLGRGSYLARYHSSSCGPMSAARPPRSLWCVWLPCGHRSISDGDRLFSSAKILLS